MLDLNKHQHADSHTYYRHMLNVLKSSYVPIAISIRLQDDGSEAIQDFASVVQPDLLAIMDVQIENDSEY